MQHCFGPQVLRSGRISARRATGTCVTVRAQVSVRPYTVRKGDTLASIATKRGVTVEVLRKLNLANAKTNELKEGQTILIPGGALSQRDKEIIRGVSANTHRMYPVRKGEKLEDIIVKRKISKAEVETLNPGINLKKLKADTLLKLPAGRFTVREREMMAGNRLVPAEFFGETGKVFGGGITAALAIAAAVMVWQRSFMRSEGGWNDVE